MAIALPQVNSSAGIDEKAAVVALTLDEIAAKVSAQLGKRTEAKATTVAPLLARGAANTVPPVAIAPIPTAPTEVIAASASGFANVRQLAAEGHFQAIAYWLNEPLVAQNVYAQVLSDEVPGRLKVLVEFEKSPQKEKLIRFVCDRLYRLNSAVIEGVHIIARPLGAAKTDWEKSVRLPTAAERREKQLSATAALEEPKKRLQKEKRQNAQTSLVRDSFGPQIKPPAVRDQFKFLRAALMCGSAIAALFFGSFTTFLLADSSLSSSAQPVDEIIPWYGKVTEPDFSQVAEVSFYPASRFQGRTVEAALETVAVIPHRKVVDPTDPTVTLLFGGELALNDFVFEQSSDIDQLFSEIDIYQRADVSMVGLAEPLAHASTSLQEDFHKRTRPQAAHALDVGGIDIVNLASESSMTYGARGLAETLNNLDRQGIYRVGAGRNQQEAHRPEVLEVKGQRVAYLGYNPDALEGAKAEKAGVALTRNEDRQHMIEDIRAIRSQVDWVVVNYRWGDTLETAEAAAVVDAAVADEITADEEPKPLIATVPEDWQKSLAHEAVDAGADLVVGYHPQHIQGAEIYRDRPIAYSLGDFTFSDDPLKDHDTAALKVSLRNQQMKVEFLPITIRESKLQKATGEHGAAILHAIRSASTTFEQPMQFPAVLKAEPIIPPEAAEPVYEESAPPLYPSAPLSPAPNPMMQESEALFMPEANGMPEVDDESLPDDYLLNERLDETIAPLSDSPLENVMFWEDPLTEDNFTDEPSETFINEPSGAIETYAEPIVGPLSAQPLNFE